jgi:hypothetical protein
MFVSFYTILKQRLKIFWSSTPTNFSYELSHSRFRSNRRLLNNSVVLRSDLLRASLNGALSWWRRCCLVSNRCRSVWVRQFPLDYDREGTTIWHVYGTQSGEHLKKEAVFHSETSVIYDGATSQKTWLQFCLKRQNNVSRVRSTWNYIKGFFFSWQFEA